MVHIKINYSFNITHPWKVTIIGQNLVYHSKQLEMSGFFIGASGNRPEGNGADIQCRGRYEISEITRETEDFKNINKISIFGLEEMQAKDPQID